MNKIATIASAIIVLLSCTPSNAASFSDRESAIINCDTLSLLRILTIDNPADTSTLRAKSTEMTASEITSEQYALLTRRMIKTVSDSTVDGVGLAAPQVGINRRVVVVQRFDKPNTPFEVYSNISIKTYGTDTTCDEEGCLSVPDKSGAVVRSKQVVISYTDPKSMTTVEETIEGFTAIIFQHEIDHLEGIIYTDRIK